MNRRSFLKIAGASALPFLGGLPACGARGRRPNVVIVLVDELRKSSADKWLTKTNELVAQAGVRFSTMRTAAPWTYPSVISLMSGLYPQQHGATGHLSLQKLSVFDPRVPLLPAILRSAGYRTTAFVTNPFLHEWNPFHLAFDTFDAHFINNQGSERMGESYFTENMYGNSVNPSVRSHFGAAGPQRPEFTYIHYMDVHGPWREGVPFAPDYESAVRYTDERITELHDYFFQRYTGNLLFMVVSDHGRSFPEDRARGYGARWRKSKASMHDFNLRVPFLLLPSDLVDGGREVTLPCSTIDVAPTVAELAAVPLGYAVPGTSLVPTMRGDTVDERPSYSQVRAFFQWSDCAVFQKKKYVRFRDVKSGRVILQRIFDLERDPEETVSIGSDFGEFQATLDRLAGGHGMSFAPGFEDVAPDVRERLQALGYLE